MSVVAAAAAILAQIAYPLVHGSVRDAVTAMVVLFLALACVAHAAARRGIGYAAALLIVTAGIGLAAEVVGTSTGIPFGCYGYAVNRIGPSVHGVPLIVPLAWTAGLHPVWIAAGRVARPAARVLGTAIAVVGWDLFLDPQMIADRQWVWCSDAPGLPGLSPAGVPPIPYTNFLGWAAVALVMALAMQALERHGRRDTHPPAISVPTVLFVWTWLGSAVAHAVFLPALGWSALYGLVAMGIVGVPFLLSIARPNRVRPTLARPANTPDH